KMDPRLFDLVWSIYQEAGATRPIMVVSGFRSLKTNNALRRRSRGVARTSQHTAGKAMDFYIPGVPVKKLREIGLKMQEGGVGYYPGSRSPFVHMDTGRVRHWPRMTPKQLAAVFPKGKTLHMSTANKKLPRYAEALAEYKKRKTKVVQPLSRSKRTLLARADKPRSNGGVLSNLFNRNKKKTPDKAKEQKTIQVASRSRTKTEQKPIPSRIGRAEEKPAKAIVLAKAPAPRPVPAGLRDEVSPVNDNAIVVASAPTPAVRPQSTLPQPAINVPQPVIAVRDEDPRPVVDGATIVASLEAANEQAQTSADERDQNPVFNEEPTPAIVRALATGLVDPTQLVLNESVKPRPVLERPAAATLAYASPNPVDSLPRLDETLFDRRFSQFSIGAGVDTKSERLKANPTIAAKAVEEPQVDPLFDARFGSNSGTRTLEVASLGDSLVTTKARINALRDALGLSPVEDDLTVTASLKPASVAVPTSTPRDITQSSSPTIIPVPRAAQRPHRTDIKPVLAVQSMTDHVGAFKFAGESRTAVSALLAKASMVQKTHISFTLPKPRGVAGLFINPTRVYDGRFDKGVSANTTARFEGNAVHLTPTVAFKKLDTFQLTSLAR
ncbi:MAG: DUF882 domain-containing protein, partial [Pseudomonadota bacterium]